MQSVTPAFSLVGSAAPDLPVTIERVRAAAYVDLNAVRDNVARLHEASSTAGLMAVVKAEAYGHGLLPSARAALAGGATWLGTAALEEALALRAAGIDVPLLTWLAAPGERYEDAIRADVDVSVYAPWALEEVAAAARTVGSSARIHLKVDTGLGRGGAWIEDWPALVDAALAAEAEGTVRVVGLWSHLAHADAPAHPTIARQVATFRDAIELAEKAGARPQVRHLANSAATLALPDTHFDLVRPGVSVYGLSPGPEVGSAAQLGLRPAMTLTARLAMVKRVPAGQGVSYGHRYVTPVETTLGLVPLGYADGIPRAASNVGPLWAAGRRRTIAGTVCMDQVVVDLEGDPAEVGDEVVLFGPGDAGEPTADDWAAAVGTINYEIVTRIGPRVPRIYRELSS
jgi:alanine racemase